MPEQPLHQDQWVTVTPREIRTGTTTYQTSAISMVSTWIDPKPVGARNMALFAAAVLLVPWVLWWVLDLPDLFLPLYTIFTFSSTGIAGLGLLVFGYEYISHKETMSIRIVLDGTQMDIISSEDHTWAHSVAEAIRAAVSMR